MNTKLKSGLAASMIAITAAVSGVALPSTADAASGDKAAILKTMSAYESALNASNTEKVMPLYTEDGIFMAPFGPSSIGTVAVRKAYEDTFKAITLKVKFSVAEVVEMSPGWAFVRTNSAGTVTVNSSGSASAEANQELFILKKGTDGTWRIARYSFSGTNPLK